MPLVTLTAPVMEGGIGRNLLNLAHALLECGVDVDLVVDIRRGHYLGELRPEVTVLESGGSHAFTGVPWLARYLRRRRPEGLLTPVPRHTVWALRARSLSRVPVRVIANVHNNYAMTLTAMKPRKRCRRIATMRRHYPRCDAMVPVSRGAADAFANVTGIPVAQLTVLPNPVLTADLQARASEPVDHAWFNDDARSPVFISVGRLEHQKNLPLLLHAFDLLRARLPCRLVIIGDGSQRHDIERRIKQSPHAGDILLLGHQDNPHRFVARAATLVLASRWEGFGNVLVEAMALGIPVVATDCPSGPAEILEHGRYGPLVPVDDAEALAEGMHQCLRAPVEAAVLIGAVGRYRADVIARRYLEAFGLTSPPVSAPR